MSKVRLTNKCKTNHAIGLQAEEYASRYLIENGYKILEHRYKTKYGEIDLIVEKDDILCFVEVKKRQTLDDALFSVDQRTRHRIEQSALFYISQNPKAQDKSMRFDVIAVSKPFLVTHLDNAWEVGA